MRLRNGWCAMLFVVAAVCVCCRSALAGAPAPWPENILRGSNIEGGLVYSEEDIAHLALDWRANIVRILVSVKLSDDGKCWYSWSSTSTENVLHLIDMCLKYRLYTVLSLSPEFSNPNTTFANAAMRQTYIAFWKDIVTRYLDSESIAYDLMNEPNSGRISVEEWAAFSQELTDSIRAVDKVHTLVVEPPAWGWPDGFANLTPTNDSNTVYSFHFYGPMDYTHQRYGGQAMATPESAWLLRPYPGLIVTEWDEQTWDKETMRTYVSQVQEFQNQYNVRIWCGELGCARWAIGAKQWFTDWIDLMEEAGFDWTIYSYREWHHMDYEMDPNERVNRTERSETELVKLFRGYFARNPIPTDFNRDGVVTPGDALELARFQLNHPDNLAADFDHDGKVGLLDVLRLLLRAASGGK